MREGGRIEACNCLPRELLAFARCRIDQPIVFRCVGGAESDEQLSVRRPASVARVGIECAVGKGNPALLQRLDIDDRRNHAPVDARFDVKQATVGREMFRRLLPRAGRHKTHLARLDVENRRAPRTALIRIGD